MVAAGSALRDGGAASVSLFDQPEVRDARGSHDIAWCDARPAGSAGRRIFPIQIETAAEATRAGEGAGACACGRGRGAGEPGAGACDEAAGAASWSKACGGEPAGVPRRRGHGKALGAGDPATGRICADLGAESGWAARAKNAGTATGHYAGATAWSGDWRRSGIGGAGTPDGEFRGSAAGSGIFRAASAGGQACNADRSHGIYWEGLAGEHVNGVAGNWAGLSAHPAAEVESGNPAF